MEAGINSAADNASTPWDGTPEAFPRSVGLRLAYGVYQLLLHLLLPLILLRLVMLGRKEPLYRRHIHHRLGLGGGSRRALWIFAASLGEARAVSPLIRELLARGETVLLTHSSAAGLSEGQRLFGEDIREGRIVQRYQPIDALVPLWLFLAFHRPRAGLVVECELWPGLMFEPRRFGIPMVAINGSYTERAQKRDRARFWGLRLVLWRGFSRVTTKSDIHKARYAATGIPTGHIHNVGELKFDLPLNEDQISAARAFLEAAKISRPIWMIASSIEGEEDALFAALKRVQSDCEKPPLILWVPRSPQRFDRVFARAKELGYDVTRRSQMFDESLTQTKPGDPGQIIVGDSIGEMDFYYALSDVVFVGATLYPMGGHNPIEPLAHEKPVVTGPSIYGVAFPAYEARDKGALRDYPDEAAMAADLIALFNDPELLADFQSRARGFNEAHKGASQRTVDVLAPVLRS